MRSRTAAEWTLTAGVSRLLAADAHTQPQQPTWTKTGLEAPSAAGRSPDGRPNILVQRALCSCPSLRRPAVPAQTQACCMT